MSVWQIVERRSSSETASTEAAFAANLLSKMMQMILHYNFNHIEINRVTFCFEVHITKESSPTQKTHAQVAVGQASGHGHRGGSQWRPQLRCACACEPHPPKSLLLYFLSLG